MFLSAFRLPDWREEEEVLDIRRMQNGGPHGYVDNTWPCGIFSGAMELSEIYFRDITVFYGGNGSGKTTLLNIIAEKLGLERSAPFNSGEMLPLYLKKCRFETDYDDYGRRTGIPESSRIITSDDVFDYMLAVRENNEDISGKKDAQKERWQELRYGGTIHVKGIEDFEAQREQLLARRKTVSRRQFVKKTLGEEMKLNSNGETALAYFVSRLENDTLYCLDEPENSMSPALQLKLKDELYQMARFCGCQFIISTHSPFLLALPGARIYDLDSEPAGIRNWWELENTKLYYQFFKENRDFFEQDP